ncbi:MAG: UDP-N-acetylmuramoyl-L-alanyl-D-glutamate--2,6-diaminopimelate ligase [Elusimicrobia bacterium]|nr:UDP-N-acetylmuramoyl-L-alanyl-D-glutamate--2,6-diaminopimelate ligase [Elusimicrobiota bacterium]
MPNYKLSDLLKKFSKTIKPLVISDLGAPVAGLTSDSRRAGPGVVFCALGGQKTHGICFAHEVLRQGSKILLLEPPLPRPQVQKLRQSAIGLGACVLVVADLRKRLGSLANWVYGNPSHNLKLAAITGTSGKTTACYLMEAIAEACGHRAGVLGTVNHRIAGKIRPASLTTPQSDETIALMAEMLKNGCDYCFMEATSQALDMGRLNDLDLDGALFANLSRDHLDYHRTMERYFRAKSKLFFDILAGSAKEGRFAAVNFDDRRGKKLWRRLADLPRVEKISYGIGPNRVLDVESLDIKLGLKSSDFILRLGQEKKTVKLQLIGRHNVSNALAAAAAAHALGLPTGRIIEGLESLKVVPGRLERIKEARDFLLLVDYAHKPEALKSVLSTLRAVPKLGRLIVVFGCGGDRDQGKRPMMGEIAARLADFAVFTSDNPRSEDPEKIIDAIEAGAKAAGRSNYLRQTDRAKAVQWAIRHTRAGDCVIIAGKGHENYQIFKDKTIHFDDREICREILKK